ncbi:two-component system phosphate regulon sensor histidine kinase PhoR [Litorimonas taeanensis]|uniref:histidine kinase n=1 Tax=Litorimonas taeanensis TaxID=568099 RepID=A0A420WDT5_9PROT|nr:ATP-binding protein [Litorimonas taeanensis]RKQ69052.1 two-component system phosphate regulon sensor histidine kinase PhoR [Litorimonas taeanensis]
MPSRPEIGLLACLAIIAILALGIIVQAPLLPTLIIVTLYAVLGWTLHRISTSKARKTESEFGTPRKSVRHLDSWINVIDALPVACALIDRDKRVIHANKRAQDLATIDKIGLPLSSYLRGTEIIQALERAQAGYSTQPVEILKLTPEERYLRVTLTTASLVRPSNGQSYLLAVITDITEDRVSQMQKADFLANASHELKTPIASLLGYIETLRHHAKDDPVAQEKFLGIMQSQAERMVRLIDDLLSLRKIEQIEHIAPEDMADINQSLKAAMEVVTPIAEKNGVTLSYKGPDKAITRATRDESVQLFLNLIDNAVKFTPRGESVKIKVSSVRNWSPAVAFRDSSLPAESPSRRIAEPPKSTIQGKVWQIQIRDQGPGFAREHLPRIGERFYRIAGDLSSKEKGTGLGLAIVKHITIRHRAGLYIRSQQGEGTEFTVVLPFISEKKAK